MTLLDLSIIYIACGAPFGVYQLTRADGISPRASLLIAASLVLWPIFLFVLIYERLTSPVLPHQEADRIRRDIESLAFGEGSTAPLFEFREIFYRYSGLVEAASAEESGYSTELVEIGQHGKTAAASKCLQRRDREKIEFHKTAARNEFIDLIAVITESGSADRASIIGLAIQLGNHLNDQAAVDDLTALSAHCKTDEPKQHDEEIWKRRPDIVPDAG